MVSGHPGGALLREALELLPPGRSAARVRLMALLAISLVMTDHAQEREDFARNAVAMARTLSEEPVLLAEALAARYQATFHAGNLRERIAWSTEASQAALDADDHVRAAHTFLYCTAGHIEEGDRTKTDITLRAANFHARHAADARYLWASRTWQALLKFAAADYDEGARLASSALSFWDHTPNVDAIACDFAQQTMVALMRGDVTTATKLLTGAVARSPDLLGARLMLCYALAADRPSEADRLISEVGPNPLVAIGQDQTQSLSWAMLAEVAGVLGPRPWLEDLIAAMAPFADQHVVINMLGGGGIYWGCLGHHLGTAQRLLGRHGDARASFENALVAQQRLGAAWWVERTSQALGPETRGRATQQR